MDNLQVASVNMTTLVQTGKRAGQPTNLIHEVTYSDGSIAYRCATCGKEWPKWTQVFAHRASHSDRKRKNAKDSVRKQRLSKANALLILAQELVSSYAEETDDSENGPLVTEIAELHAALDAERKARKKAEADLRKIRSLLSAG